MLDPRQYYEAEDIRGGFRPSLRAEGRFMSLIGALFWWPE